MTYEIRVHEVIAGTIRNKTYIAGEYTMTENKWGAKKIRLNNVEGKQSAVYINGEKSYQKEYEVDIYEATTGRKVESFR